MKAIYLLIVSLLVISNDLLAQNNMYIFKNNGSVLTLSLDEVDSITYSVGSNNPISSPGAGVSFDGFTYSSIVLGNGQEWMVENLRTSVYANGDPIPEVTNNIDWVNLTSGAWCYIYNDNQYESLFGKLYNWYAAVDSRNVCPTGWHVPSDTEWDNLLYFLDPNANIINGNVAGAKIKSLGNVVAGNGYWENPNIATNDYGFFAFPGGNRVGASNGVGIYASYGYLRYNGFFWSSLEESSEDAFYRVLEHDESWMRRSYDNKYNGLSIRCIKD